MINKITDIFRQKFFVEPLVVRAPGRVNIIGEHTDYNEGFVLPAAIDKSIFVAVSKINDGQAHLYSADFDESFHFPLLYIEPTKKWTTYILGVVDQLLKRGCHIEGFNLAVYGDIPIGAGLSSSAALECATVFALNELFSLGLEKIEMVRIAQKAENTYGGVMCGIMDQFASMFGKRNHVIKLDCRSLQYEYKPLKLEGYKIVLFDTNVKHKLASTEYNTRREQCEQGVKWIQERYEGITSLRGVTIEMLQQCVAPQDDIIYKRCKYVVEETQRLLAGCEDLERGDIQSLGRKMFQTHEDLASEYEVSCRELDFLVSAVRGNPAVLGARMMGGGFGGCTINLVKESAIEELTQLIYDSYKMKMKLEMTPYVVEVEQGTQRINSNVYANV